jgi:hypothetical protein
VADVLDFPFSWQADGRSIELLGSFSALEKITASSRVLRAQEQGKVTVIFDSGIRMDSDVIKVIAMGAQGVLGERGASLLCSVISYCHCDGSVLGDSGAADHVWTCTRRRGGCRAGSSADSSQMPRSRLASVAIRASTRSEERGKLCWRRWRHHANVR